MNIEAGPHNEQRSKGGCLKILGFGCAGFIVMLLIGAFIVYLNYKSLTTWMVNYRTEEYLGYSNMQDSHKQAVRLQRDRVLAAFKDGSLDEAALATAAEGLYDDPIFPGFVSLLICADLAPKTGLNKDEQAELHKQLSRLTRASAEEKMDGKTYQQIIEAIIVRDEKDVPSLREDVDAESLKTITASAQQHADTLAIPDEVYDFAFETALTEFVDTVLGEQEL